MAPDPTINFCASAAAWVPEHAQVLTVPELQHLFRGTKVALIQSVTRSASTPIPLQDNRAETVTRDWMEEKREENQRS